MDPVRALELWTNHRHLVIAVLDARMTAEVYRRGAAGSSSAGDMSADEVDWMMELDELVENFKGPGETL